MTVADSGDAKSSLVPVTQMELNYHEDGHGHSLNNLQKGNKADKGIMIILVKRHFTARTTRKHHHLACTVTRVEPFQQPFLEPLW